MNLTMLSDKELLRLASHQYTMYETINHEWLNRYQLYFPYKLVDGKIYNTILERAEKDENCDRLVVKMANELRNKQGQKD